MAEIDTDLVGKLRRMVAEPTTDTYSDKNLWGFIEEKALNDEFGQCPTLVNYTTTPPTKTENELWVPTYDLNAAAAEVWTEKAGTVAEDFSYSADGGSFTRSDKYKQYLAQSKYYRSLRRARSVSIRGATRVGNNNYEGDNNNAQ